MKRKGLKRPVSEEGNTTKEKAKTNKSAETTIITECGGENPTEHQPETRGLLFFRARAQQKQAVGKTFQQCLGE